MELIDTHLHLDHQRFAHDTADVVKRAREAGVVQMISIGSNLDTSQRAIELAESFPEVFATVGIHPHEASSTDEAAYARLAEWAAHPKVVAIGEIGLDYHYNFSEPQVQRRVFRRQLELAREVNLPVVIHDREAHDDIVRLLEETRDRGLPPAVLHSFTGSWEMAQHCLERFDIHFSIGGMVTFKNTQAIRDVFVRIPLHRIMLETDAPYLSPEPFRGRRNESFRLPVIAERLAQEREMEMETLARETTENARRFFGLPKI